MEPCRLAFRFRGDACVSSRNNNHENRARLYGVFTPSAGRGTNAWLVGAARRRSDRWLPCAMLSLYCCVTGRGAAVGNAFVEVGIVVSGSGDAAVVESGALLVGDGAVAGSG